MIYVGYGIVIGVAVLLVLLLAIELLRIPYCFRNRSKTSFKITKFVRNTSNKGIKMKVKTANEEITLGKCENYVVTMELRFINKTIEVRHPKCWGDHEFEFLEQKWVCLNTGKFEWRPVPRVCVTERIEKE